LQHFHGPIMTKNVPGVHKILFWSPKSPDFGPSKVGDF
jgi:hypothetical protein